METTKRRIICARTTSTTHTTANNARTTITITNKTISRCYSNSNFVPFELLFVVFIEYWREAAEIIVMIKNNKKKLNGILNLHQPFITIFKIACPMFGFFNVMFVSAFVFLYTLCRVKIEKYAGKLLIECIALKSKRYQQINSLSAKEQEKSNSKMLMLFPFLKERVYTVVNILKLSLSVCLP